MLIVRGVVQQRWVGIRAPPGPRPPWKQEMQRVHEKKGAERRAAQSEVCNSHTTNTITTTPTPAPSNLHRNKEYPRQDVRAPQRTTQQTDRKQQHNAPHPRKAPLKTQHSSHPIQRRASGSVGTQRQHRRVPSRGGVDVSRVGQKGEQERRGVPAEGASAQRGPERLPVRGSGVVGRVEGKVGVPSRGGEVNVSGVRSERMVQRASVYRPKRGSGRKSVPDASGGEVEVASASTQTRTRSGAERIIRPETKFSGVASLVNTNDAVIAAYLRKNHKYARGGGHDSAQRAHRINLLRRDVAELDRLGCTLGLQSIESVVTLYRKMGAVGIAADFFLDALHGVARKGVAGATGIAVTNSAAGTSSTGSAGAAGTLTSEEGRLRRTLNSLNPAILSSGLLALVQARKLDDFATLMRLCPARLGDHRGSSVFSGPTSVSNAVLEYLTLVDASRAEAFFKGMTRTRTANATSLALYVRICSADSVVTLAHSLPEVTDLNLSAFVRRVGENSLADAEKVWMTLVPKLKTQTHPSVRAYNTLLQVARLHKEAERVLHYVTEMSAVGLQGDAATYATCISACAECSASPDDRLAVMAESMFDHAVTNGFGGNVYICAAVACLHARHQNIAKMKQLADHMHLEQVFLTTVIKGYMAELGM